MSESPMPAFTMSRIFRRPVPNTMAFGGVPTGIMKAKDAEIVIAKSGASGLKCSDSDAAATIGIIVAARAVLEVTSEVQLVPKATPQR